MHYEGSLGSTGDKCTVSASRDPEGTQSREGCNGTGCVDTGIRNDFSSLRIRHLVLCSRVVKGITSDSDMDEKFNRRTVTRVLFVLWVFEVSS